MPSSDSKLASNRDVSQLLANLSFKGYMLLYSAVFALSAVCCFAVLAVNGLGFINGADGLSIHFARFLSMGELIRTMVSSFLETGQFVFPTYNLYNGYGEPLNCFCDPFTYVSAFCAPEDSEAVFSALIILRLWLAGLAFSILCKRTGLGNSSMLVGAVVYVFSSYGLHSMLQTSFLLQLILFPLVILGAIQVIAEGKHLLLLLTIVASYYFCGAYVVYMFMLFMAVFAICFLCKAEFRALRKWLASAANLLGILVVASLLAAPVVIGQIENLASLDRVSFSYDNPAVLSLGGYYKLFAGFLSFYWGERDWFFGYGAIALVSVIVLLATKGNRLLKLLLFLGVVFMAFPIFGVMANGFAYYANRWVWAFALLIAYIVAMTAKSLTSLSKRTLLAVGIMLAIYSIMVLLMPVKHSVDQYAQVALVAVAYCMLLLVNFPKATEKLRRQNVALCGFLVIAIASAGLNYWFFVSPSHGSWAKYLVPAGQAYERLTSGSPTSLASEAGWDGIYRYDQDYDIDVQQRAIGLQSGRVLGLAGIDFYNSLYNSYVDKFNGELAIAGTPEPNVFRTLDGRTVLEHLAGVRYFIAREGDGMPIPYGYTDSGKHATAIDGNEYRLYEFSDSASIAYLANREISKSQYEGALPLQRQELLAKGVVLEDPSDFEVIEDLETVDAEFRIASSNGVEIEPGKVVVKEKSATVTINFEGLPDSETYIYVDSLKVQPTKASAQVIKVDVESDSSSGIFKTMTASNHLYAGRKTWLWNLGYSSEAQHSVTLTFQDAGTYSFDDFRVQCQPMSVVKAQIEAMSKSKIETISFNGQSLSLIVDAGYASDGVDDTVERNADINLVLTVPFSKDWCVTIDGDEAEIQRVNTAFMAVNLAPGKHHVIFSYSKPHLSEAVAFAISLVLISFYVLFERKKKTLKFRAKERIDS